MGMIRTVVIVFLFFAVGHMSSPVYAADYYVSPSGNDTNTGTINHPFKTINRAAGLVNPGDIIYVRDGVYQEAVTISRSGNTNTPIKLLAYPGEQPIIDGNNYTIAANWGVLLRLAGDYLQASGFEVRYSGGMGALLSGKNNLFDDINSHHNWENGILITGDNSVVQNSRVWSNCMSNVSGTSTTYWASGLSAARHPNNAIIRNNTVYGNWGEGLSTYEANGTIIEGNVIYDNWSANSYISDATNVVFQRNIVYASGNMTGGSQVGIMMGDEKQLPASGNNTVINNVVYGTNRNFYWWRNNIFSVDGMRHDLVAFNTFVHSRGTANVIIASSPDHLNTRFVNNIMIQDDSLSNGNIATNISVGNNLWSKAPSSGFSSTDIIANPLLKGPYPVNPDSLQDDWFKLTADSPAIDKARVLSEVNDDFFTKPRSYGSAPDIGAHEYTPSPPPTTKPGDANGDGRVDGLDYVVWLNNYGRSDATGPSQGDFNADARVDGLDYVIWLNNYGT